MIGLTDKEIKALVTLKPFKIRRYYCVSDEKFDEIIEK